VRAVVTNEEHRADASAVTTHLRVEQDAAEPQPTEAAPAATLSGVVRVAGGAPVAGVEVSTSVQHPEDPRRRIGIDDLTDGEGRFEELLHEPLTVKAQNPQERYFGVWRSEVEPDAAGLVLELIDYREVELVVRDVSGSPVESLLPFEISVESDRHETEERGPFEPAAFPERIDFVLAELEVVSGRVVSRGEPVEGASVVLIREMYNPLDEVVDDYSTGLFYGWNDEPPRTDATGVFRIPSRFAHMGCHVLASADGLADGLAGPARVGDAPLVVEMGAGGGVAGVLRSDAEAVAGLEVLLYRVMPRGEPFRPQPPAGQVHRSVVAVDGSFAFEHVRPGDWLLRVRDESESAPFPCRVEEGLTAALELDLDEPPACHLAFRLTVDGDVYRASVELRTESLPSLVVDTGSVRDDGWIDLVAREPGRYRVIWRGGPGHHQSKKVSGVVDLTPGENVWEHDLSPERWRGEGVSLEGD
jgi:hypothetical protein